jgi:hypothetical protein
MLVEKVFDISAPRTWSTCFSQAFTVSRRLDPASKKRDKVRTKETTGLTLFLSRGRDVSQAGTRAASQWHPLHTGKLVGCTVTGRTEVMVRVLVGSKSSLNLGRFMRMIALVWGSTMSNPDGDPLHVYDAESSHASGVCLSEESVEAIVRERSVTRSDNEASFTQSDDEISITRRDDETPTIQSGHPNSATQITEAKSIQFCPFVAIPARFLKLEICVPPAAGRTASRAWKQ